MEKIIREIALTENMSILVKIDQKTDIYTARTEAELIQKITNMIERSDNSVSQITQKERYEQPEHGSLKGVDKEQFLQDYEAIKSSGKENWKETLCEKYGLPIKNIYQRYKYYKKIVNKKSGTIQIKRTRTAPVIWSDNELKYLEKALKDRIPRKEIKNHLGKTSTQISNKIYNITHSVK